MSETPRTDAAWYASESGAGCEPLLKCSLQLERELSSLRRKLAAAESIMKQLKQFHVGHLRAEVDAALAAWQEANKI